MNNLLGSHSGELYDLATDLGERSNVFDPPRAAALVSMLDAGSDRCAARDALPAALLSEQDLRRLEALGSRHTGTPGPDRTGSDDR